MLWQWEKENRCCALSLDSRENWQVLVTLDGVAELLMVDRLEFTIFITTERWYLFSLECLNSCIAILILCPKLLMIGPLIIGIPLKHTQARDKDLIWDDSEGDLPFTEKYSRSSCACWHQSCSNTDLAWPWRSLFWNTVLEISFLLANEMYCY